MHKCMSACDAWGCSEWMCVCACVWSGALSNIPSCLPNSQLTNQNKPSQTTNHTHICTSTLVRILHHIIHPRATKPDLHHRSRMPHPNPPPNHNQCLNPEPRVFTALWRHVLTLGKRPPPHTQTGAYEVRSKEQKHTEQHTSKPASHPSNKNIHCYCNHYF